jgi:hypothetical protein
MDKPNPSVKVSYKPVGDGHFFWSHDKKAKGLLVSDSDIGSAVEKVSETLQRRTHMKWTPSETSVALLDKVTKDKNGQLGSMFLPSDLSVNLSWIAQQEMAES